MIQTADVKQKLIDKIRDFSTFLGKKSDIIIEKSADPLDNVVSMELRDRAAGDSDRWRSAVRELEEAMIRLDRGVYGICEGCEEKIADKRLQAVLDARCCIRCQEIQDKIVLT